MNKWHRHNLRVHYKETDQMGVVHHANYVSWLEIARTEYMRMLGMPYNGIEEMGLMLPVLKVEVDYRKPARYYDSIAIYTRVKMFTPVRLEFCYEVRKAKEETSGEALGPDRFEAPEGELLTTAVTSHMWVNREWKPVRLNHASPKLYDLLEKMENEA